MSSNIDKCIQEMVKDTVRSVSVALLSTFGEKVSQLEQNDVKFAQIFSHLNDRLKVNQSTVTTLREELATNHTTIVSLTQELATVKAKLEVSETLNANLSQELQTNGVSNEKLSAQNIRMKKRARTYMKFEEKFNMIIQNVVHWNGNQFYLPVSVVQRIFEHSTKPSWDFNRTLKSHGYMVTKKQWREEYHYICVHPTFTKADIHLQMRLYKKKRLDEDDELSDSSNSLFDFDLDNIQGGETSMQNLELDAQ